MRTSDVFFLAIDTIRKSQRELGKHMIVTEKTSTWTRDEQRIIGLARKFREATQGDTLSRLCEAYGVVPGADEEETRRLLQQAMLDIANAHGVEGCEGTQAHP